nr:MAG: DUF1993 domain-containing protein [Hyphomicrobiales bacterium]
MSTYDSCVPVFIQMLTCQRAILGKAEAYAAAKKIDESVLMNARLYPDMFPFKKQIQILTDFCNRAAARLSGSEIPSHPDTEEILSQLKQRITATLDFISALKAEKFEGSESKTYQIPMGGDNKMEMTGQDYLFHFVLPNVVFHAATAYGILRHNGLEIGKLDFMKPPE